MVHLVDCDELPEQWRLVCIKYQIRQQADILFSLAANGLVVNQDKGLTVPCTREGLHFITDKIADLMEQRISREREGKDEHDLEQDEEAAVEEIKRWLAERSREEEEETHTEGLDDQ